MENKCIGKELFSVLHGTYFKSVEDVRLTARVLKYLGSRFLYTHLIPVFLKTREGYFVKKK